MSKNGVAILNVSSLRRGQRSLYRLIVEKLDTQQAITLKEATEIWSNSVHSNNDKDGHPMRWNYYAGRYEENGQVYYRGALERMADWEIEDSVMNWLMKNIGLLVIRGYLKVIPMIALELEKS